jgi:hypothetical protein
MIHEKQAGPCKRGLACFAVFILAKTKGLCYSKGYCSKENHATITFEEMWRISENKQEES